MSVSVRQVLAKIDCPFLSLYKGDGYWYFVYDIPQLNIFETKSVYTMRLNSLPLDTWVADGKELVTLGDEMRRDALVLAAMEKGV